MKVSTQHYIDGVNVKDMSKGACISCIVEAEKKLTDLSNIATESKAITAELARIEGFIADVVKHLDSKS